MNRQFQRTAFILNSNNVKVISVTFDLFNESYLIHFFQKKKDLYVLILTKIKYDIRYNVRDTHTSRQQF